MEPDGISYTDACKSHFNLKSCMLIGMLRVSRRRLPRFHVKKSMSIPVIRITLAGRLTNGIFP